MKLLALDFDGCLHKGSDPVWLNFPAGTPAWQLEVGLKAQKRFVWAPALAEVIDAEGPDLAIVIHSTWRRRYDDATMKHFLPPTVASRVISLDGQIEGRERLTSDEYLRAAIDLIAPSSVCVIDDRPEFFYGGQVKNWIGHNHGKFIWCNPDVGVQDPSVKAQLLDWTHSDPEHELSHHPVPGVN
jgi:hypothetical protein